jgi:hypothetical protein
MALTLHPCCVLIGVVGHGCSLLQTTVYNSATIQIVHDAMSLVCSPSACVQVYALLSFL